ncbi:TetR/AcrR family transcriptional regulator [Streptomyces sp. NPDC002564]|uniref:TetR/AcrR family transcriptional regulator n=1 Tax=Streptomyces sp. NPDC002564 TaxID=3364649 RepID=UPI0036CA39E9
MSELDAGLRARLVDVGVELVTAEGVQALTLREIARRAGVSHGAPRRHFPTHGELLSAIARRGFAELAAVAGEAVGGAVGEGTDRDGRDGAEDADREGREGAQDADRDGRERGPDARARLKALSRAYLGFAAAHRGMFELMFRHDLLESNRLGLRDTSLPLFDVLVGLVAEARPASGTAPRIVAGALWANLHGIAQLWGWGSLRLATGAEDVEALLDAALTAHLGPADA